MKYIDWVKLWEKEGHIGVNIPNLIDDWTEERNYQRRHRKWALGEAFFQKGRGNRLYKILKETVVELNKALSWQRERTEKAEADNKELFETLAGLMLFEDDTDATGTEWHDGHERAIEIARAVLNEVKNKEKQNGV